MPGRALRAADLRGADLRGAEIRHCDFRGAGLDGALLAGAACDLETGWPIAFDLRRAGVRRVEMRSEPPRPATKEPQEVTIRQLAAGPAQFDGRRVRVVGWVCLEFEGTAVYERREDEARRDYQTSLWLCAPAPVGADLERSPLHHRFAVIEGTFGALEKGHMGLWPGGLFHVTRIAPCPEPVTSR